MSQSLNISHFKEKQSQPPKQVRHSDNVEDVAHSHNMVNLNIKNFITKYKAKSEAKRVIKSLKEVKDFESGKKKPKSFDDFLKSL